MRLTKVGTRAVVGLAVLSLVGCVADTRASARKSKNPDDGIVQPGGATSAEPAAAAKPQTTILPAVPRAETRERALALLLTYAKTGTAEERANALEALVPTPARLATVIEPALLDPNEGLRTVAAMTVGKAKLTSVSGAVTPLLKDPSPWVRAAALYAVKRCGQNINISPLADMLLDSSPRVRAHAAYILGELGDPSAVPMLREIAKDNLGRADPGETRLLDLQIAEARLKLHDEAAIAEVRAALFPAKPEDLEAAVLACQIVGQIKDQPSANTLIQLASQKDPTGAVQAPEVRLAAAGALAMLDHEPRKARFVAFEYFAGERDTLRGQAAFVLGLSRDPSVMPVLARMLDDPSGRVRVAAAAAIVKMTE